MSKTRPRVYVKVQQYLFTSANHCYDYDMIICFILYFILLCSYVYIML